MENTKMQKSPILYEKDNIKKLKRVPLTNKTFNEEWIQELLERTPSILPTGEVDNIFSPLMFIAREVRTDSGYIDNLYISSKGYLVIVETKLWRNPEARREVVGQIIDYGAEAKKWSYDDVNDIYKKYHKTEKSLFDNLVELNYQEEDNEFNFIDVLEKNIKSARFLLMIVGDGIREGVERMTDFLNSTPNMEYRFALCELEVYKLDDNKRLVIPNLTTKTKLIERGIIRLDDKGKLFDIAMEEKAEEKKTYNKSDNLTFDEWLDKYIKLNKHEDYRDLIDDFINYRFSYSIGTADLNIMYHSDDLKRKLKLLMFWGDNKTIAFQPLAYYRFVEAYEYSSKLVDKLLEELRPYLREKQTNIPYERKNGYYYISQETMINKKEEILSILDNFISNF